jgi:hypothetical protein
VDKLVDNFGVVALFSNSLKCSLLAIQTGWWINGPVALKTKRNALKKGPLQ